MNTNSIIESFVGNKPSSNNFNAANHRANISQHNFASIKTSPSGSSNITKTLGASGNTSTLFRPSNISNVFANNKGIKPDSLGSRHISSMNIRDNINARINKLNDINDSSKDIQQLRQNDIKKIVENPNNIRSISGFDLFKSNFLQDPTHASWNAKYNADKHWTYITGYYNTNNVWISGYWKYDPDNTSNQDEFLKYMLDEFIKSNLNNSTQTSEHFDISSSSNHTFIVVIIILICLIFLIKSLHI